MLFNLGFAGEKFAMSSKISVLIGILFLCLAASFAPGRDKEKVAYHLERGSRIWIDGNATLGSYECKTVAVYGIGNIDSSSIKESSATIGNNSDKKTEVSVQVRLFDCGNPMMNEDMYKALRANNDSLISYELIKATVLYDSTRGNSSIGLRTIGNLTIGGVTRQDTIDTVVRILPGKKYEIVGSKYLFMSDFNIIPPTAFFGLIRADEKLVVGFDLIAAPSNDEVE
jgi:hypothetical protein